MWKLLVAFGLLCGCKNIYVHVDHDNVTLCIQYEMETCQHHPAVFQQTEETISLFFVRTLDYDSK
jgi:hypothetical protein